MVFSVKERLKQEIIKNLLSAQKRAAGQGPIKDVVLITKFLLKVVEKCDDILIDDLPEN